MADTLLENLNGSSPHTRGAPCPPTPSDRTAGIIPAYAGSTSSYPTCELPRTDHPRIRGEHGMSSVPEAPPRAGSSPHTRGAHPRRRSPPASGRIIPAYAGSTTASADGVSFDADHPRIRGEHEGLGQWSRREEGSSPHTRGAPATWTAASISPRIIPAYAGSTQATLRWRRSPPDHPRIRGEHPACPSPPSQRGGSSPHTRGARRRR